MSHASFESGLVVTVPASHGGSRASAAGASILLHGSLLTALFLLPLTRASEGPQTASWSRLVLPTLTVTTPAPTPAVVQRAAARGRRAAAAPPRMTTARDVEPSQTALLIHTDAEPHPDADVIDPLMVSDPTPGSSTPCAVGALCDGPGSVEPATPQHETVRVGGVIAEPRLLEGRPPVYPPIAIAVGVSATVVIEAHVLQDGRVVEAHVLRGHSLFDEAALQSVRSRRYEPLRLNGIPTDFIITITVKFSVRR